MAFFIDFLMIRTMCIKIGVLSAMKEMRTVDAIGQVLCQDITQIVRGVTKNGAVPQGPRDTGRGHPRAAVARQGPHLHLGRERAGDA